MADSEDEETPPERDVKVLFKINVLPFPVCRMHQQCADESASELRNKQETA